MHGYACRTPRSSDAGIAHARLDVLRAGSRGPLLRIASCRSEQDRQYYDGTIHDYDQENDCYNISFEEHPGTTAALQFHQVRGEETQQRPPGGADPAGVGSL